MSKDYYQILGVNRSASKEEIKKAFHRLAHKYHPDKKGGDENRFKEANEAYQTLADDRKRAQYDQFGDAAGASGFGGNPGSGFDFDFSNFTGGNGQGFSFDLGDIFGDFFGGGRSTSSRQAQRGRDISVDIQISFADAIFGTGRNVLINKIGVCDTCAGSGAEKGSALKPCATCNGQGKLNETKRSFLGTFTTARVCDNCHGSGKVPEKLCSACGGYGTIKKTEEVRIRIPFGIENGEMIRMSNQGEAVTHGVAGDLYIRIHVDKHPTFRRDGANLLMDLNVKLTDALLGTDYKIKTLDGELTVKIPAGISSGEILRVRDRGVPVSANRRGDLMIKVKVSTPTKFSHQAKKLIEELRGEGV